MQAVRSKSSQFIDRWSGAERSSVRLGIALMGALFICGILSIALVYMSFKPKSIYYIPGVSEAGMALPQSMPKSAVAVFVSSWVLNWSNFTPVTVRDVYSRAQRFMSPALLAQTRSRLNKDLDEVKRNNISSLFSITNDPTVDVEGKGFIVTLQGEKGIYVGKEEIKIQRMLYRVYVRSVDPTENNPYGLMIEKIEQEAVS